MTRKFFALLLALFLLAGCGTAAAPSSPEGSSSSSISMAPPTEPETVLPQEDPEHPGVLAGATGVVSEEGVLHYTGYYMGGHCLTLYAMEPGTGALRVVREGDFWNGRKVESVSPSGSRLLLYSEDGAPIRRVAGLSVYDIEKDALVNLERTIEGPCGNWEQSHWFPAMGDYCFVDEDTFYYRRLCYREDPERPHLHRYDIGEDATVTASFLELESPENREWGWEPSCVFLPEKGELFSVFEMGEGSMEWFTWDIDTGKLLSRTPGNNSWARNHYYVDRVFYTVEQDTVSETFALTAYHIDTDTRETLAAGVIPRVPEMEHFAAADTPGVLENVWVRDIREGKFVLRSGSYIDKYRETIWDPAAGGEIVFGELMDAPTFPVEDAAGYAPVFAVSPEGDGMYIPLPRGLAEQYDEYFVSGQPYPLAVLPTGELLFLAKSMEMA